MSAIERIPPRIRDQLKQMELFDFAEAFSTVDLLVEGLAVVQAVLPSPERLRFEAQLTEALFKGRLLRSKLREVKGVVDDGRGGST